MESEERIRKENWSARKKVIAIGTALITLVGLYFLIPIITVVFIAQPVKVEGSGMSPTLNDGDRILLSKRLPELRRGDIVVFYYPSDTTKSFIKRVVGLPGETIRLNERGQLYIDNILTAEPYIHPDRNRIRRAFPEHRVEEGKYYVMGDNRDASNDSRSFGTIQRELIYGKVVWRYWPMTGEVN